MPKRVGWFAVWAVLSCCWSADIRAAEPDYVRDIKPLLHKKCLGCHGNLQQKGDLRLDHQQFWLGERPSGPAVVPGDLDQSLLWLAVNGLEGLSRMPLEADPLSDSELELLKSWILAGAPAPEEPLPGDPRDHWSFQRPVQAAVPETPWPAWNGNPIDRFVGAELARQKLTPANAAEKQVLLRRVYLDLVGLPPTRSQLQAFLADESPDAYEKVVDELLASPQYGERWGRHWMDVWRYSDWDGYGAEIRESQAHIWRWRDWIIESLNADVPYDEMVRQMLAADELYPADEAKLRATGFLARNWFRFNRQVWLDNTMEHTSKAFLGLTANCAKCHDHMFDPLSQQEYYQLRAVFEPYNVRTDRVPGQSDITKDGLVRVFDAEINAQTFLFERGDEKRPQKDNPLTAAVPALWTAKDFAVQPVTLPPVAYYPGLSPAIRQETLASADRALADAEQQREQAQRTVAAAQQRLDEFLNRPADTPIETPRLLDEKFAEARPELWDPASGTWQYENGHLLQTGNSSDESTLNLKPVMPRDFLVRFRFKITGGQMWKSLGLSFDALSSGQLASVYLSAYAGGPKVQIFYKTNGQAVYPGEGSKPYPVELQKEHELFVAVRDQLVNVGVDGKLQLAYRLPQPRTAENRLTLWTYDSQGELLECVVEPLSPELVLVEKIAGEMAVPTQQPANEATLRAAVASSTQALEPLEKSLQIARLTRTAWDRRIAADDQVYAQPPGPQAKELSQAAVQAERELAVAQADLNLLTATRAQEQAQAALQPDKMPTQKALETANAKLTEAQKALETAQQTLTQPLNENYTKLSPLYPSTSTGRRAALAQWITSPGNPLTARVAVNHIWMRHMGQPLVSSVFDFGLNGKAPTHPQLLDWLAIELQNSGWKMKAFHRLLLTSQVYRLSSDPRQAAPANLALDGENRYYWRFHARRMEAEVVRDSMLSVAGNLDSTMGGPDLDQNSGQTVPRRSLYFRIAKEKKDLFLSLFDAPNVVECYQRAETVVPQQALAMANSPLALAQSRRLAATLSQEVGAQAESAEAFVRALFLQTLTREPSADELSTCQEFLQSQQSRYQQLSGLQPFAAPATATVGPASDPGQRARENLVHVLLNHHDFVTIR